jgi:hypothetical protein
MGHHDNHLGNKVLFEDISNSLKDSIHTDLSDGTFY